jgi:hypothetical protein
LTVDDLTLLSVNPVRVPLHVGRYQLVHVVSVFVNVPYVIANLRTLAKVEHAVAAQSIVYPHDSYVISATVGIDGLSLTSSRIELLKETQRKHELLHFSYVAYLVGVVSNRCNLSTPFPPPRYVVANAAFPPVLELVTMVLCGY